MSVTYALAYRFGITPWERAGEGGRDQLEDLFAREEHGEPPHGRALDVGCGRGMHSIELARRGWEVTGLDLIPRAIQAARERARAADSHASFVAGDVTALPAQVGSGFRFVLDLGCYQGMSPAARRLYGRQVTAVTEPGAILLLLAFAPGGRIAIPRGADADDLAAALPQWSIVDVDAAVTTGMPGPMRARTPQFYRLRRAA